jgi:exodeoxyribonuclease V alpha subunit
VSEFDAEVTVRRQRFASEASGFAVLEAEAPDGEELVLVGPLIHLEERERARVVGHRVVDRRYGPQIAVQRAEPLPPSDAEALLAYLRRVRHVGVKRARAVLERFGVDGVFAGIDADPPAAFAAVGLGAQRAREAAGSWEELRVTRRLHLLLAPHGLAYLVGRIHDAYGAGAYERIRRSPYALTSLFGVGFAIADRIARGLGTAGEGPERAKAAIMHALAETERAGSTCMTEAALLRAAGALLEAAEPGRGLLDELAGCGDVVREREWVYRRAAAELETEAAERLESLIAAEPSDRLRDPGERPAGAEELTCEQREAVRNAFTHCLSLLTGGPGTGKTATIRAIARLAEEQRARLVALAPTGRAAVRMREASGVAASTVHSALGWIPGEGLPQHDEDAPLECDLVILDESSMANLELLVVLLRAIGADTHLVLVGDADQLAPVGMGKPFAELVQCARVPTVCLTHIFRQAAGSMIVQGAHSVKRGEPPSFRPAEGMRRDLFLIERADPLAARREVVSLVSERLPSHYELDPIADIQVFAPVYRGELGIDALNQALREALNPAGRTVRGGRLRIGDKVMMTGRNLHELGLMNGTVMRLEDEVEGEDDDAALLLASEESVFRLPAEQAERLVLAYACSVHRGQGIELPLAVIVAHPAAGAHFLRREMLYTALTRARTATVVVGSHAALARAARTADTGRRQSRLAERLREQP